MTGILKVYVREEKLVREERSKLGNNFFFLYAPGVCAYMDATLLVMTFRPCTDASFFVHVVC